jgi:hypothetical protein
MAYRRSPTAGALVTPRATEWLRVPCTVQLEDGGTCGQESLPKAPFPICARHAIEAYRHVNATIATNALNSALRINGVTNKHLGPSRGEFTKLTSAVMNGWPSVVYYARIGEHIKIGWTKQLHHRMRWYPPCARLLAVEQGDATTERERHQRFVHLRVARAEWFSPGDDLMEHIRELADKGLPPGPSVIDPVKVARPHKRNARPL